MAMKFCALLFLVILYFVKIESRCINILSNEEQECAAPLNLDASSIYKFYQTDSENPKFNKYLNCVWLKWGYVDNNGVILYDNLLKLNDVPWQMLRICEDVVQYMNQMETDFQEAIEYCMQQHLLVESPLTVRKCIHDNYKPTPVSL